MSKIFPVFSILRRNMGFINCRSEYWLDRVGNREMVGFGMNGLPMYVDHPHFPFPALRYKEITPELQALFLRQKGDWKRLSREQKKELYRANFCQTFEEFTAPRGGEWMGVIGSGLILISAGIWLYIFYLLFVRHNDPLPVTFMPSRNRAQLRRRIDMREDPIFGLASNWDYRKMDWKVKTWLTPDNPFIKCPEDGEGEE
ncbi:cytochrome c oxidase subunit 4 isoform 1, mitochondrial-like [Diabrotica virgifera virgifera]|uniref:Cytochrome c oxidase subunit 4 n=1 Tax=Diabrotica virgifera virgifera TaxID=50390 RepID=A0ABM5IUC5_DIAVI|nr:cytochrome c oxidase subunit 4 isoform 1, mitochondrial-like [Diabrotica virgifera virgifera]